MKNGFTDQSTWIWKAQTQEENTYLLFRQTFLADESQPVHIRISAEGNYAVFCNGAHIRSTQYPDYPHYKSVQTVELPTSAGENLLLIQVWHPNADTSVTRKELPGLRFEVYTGCELLCASTSETQVSWLPGYRQGKVRNISPQLGVGFEYADPQCPQWENAVQVSKNCFFVERPIPELEIGEPTPAKLISQGVFLNHSSKLQQYAFLGYRELTDMNVMQKDRFPNKEGLSLCGDQGDGIYLVLDLGRETVGHLMLDVVCPEGTCIDVGFGEHLEDLRVRTDMGGKHFTLHCWADAHRRPFTHWLARTGCRYLQIFIYNPRATVYYAGLLPVRYPMAANGSFSCQDSLHNLIYEIGKYTLECCVHEHYEDCPWREQALYPFDARNQMLCGYYAFGEFCQPRESLRLIAKSQRPDGLVEMCPPSNAERIIPSFSLAFVMAVEEYVRYSGDLSFGGEMLPVLERILAAFAARTEKDLVYAIPNESEDVFYYWNFYEWNPGLNGKDPQVQQGSAEAPLQLYYIIALQRVCAICGYLGMDGGIYAQQADRLSQAMEAYWCKEMGCYASFIRGGEQVSFAELTQALALYAEIVPEARKQLLRQKLLDGSLIPVTLSCSIYKYEALLQDPVKYRQPVFDEIAKIWGNMLRQGATTFWEVESGAAAFRRSGSLCHGWSAIPVYLYNAYGLGVKTTSPGKWEVVDPLFENAHGVLHTPMGQLEI